MIIMLAGRLCPEIALDSLRMKLFWVAQKGFSPDLPSLGQAKQARLHFSRMFALGKVDPLYRTCSEITVIIEV